MEKQEARQWAIWILGLGIALFLAWYFTPEQRALRLCEVEIKKALKAPSTYNRIDYSSFGEPLTLSVEYEAQNSYGAPIRRKGHCNLNLGMTRAAWTDYGEL